MPKEDIQQTYGVDMKWDKTEAVKKTLRNTQSVSFSLLSKVYVLMWGLGEIGTKKGV